MLIFILIADMSISNFADLVTLIGNNDLIFITVVDDFLLLRCFETRYWGD